MGKFRSDSEHLRTGKGTAICFSFLLAMGLHAVFLMLPLLPDLPKPEAGEVRIDLQFSKVPAEPTEPPKPVALTIPEAPEPEPAPEPEQIPVPENEPVKQITEMPVEQEISEPVSASIESASHYSRKPLEQMDDNEKQRLTHSLLSRQFINDESVTEQLFGKPLLSREPDNVADFQIPVRTNMITLLDKPMPDLPFAYQEGLVHFAYDPGVRGDLQRFWDVITPEIAFRTKYGTEVRCIWVLIIGGCAWK